MYRRLFKQLEFSNTILVLLFLYLGVVYFSFAISNILLGLIGFVFLVGVLKKKTKLRFNKNKWLLYLLIIAPFLLTILSVLNSNNYIKGFSYLTLRLPILSTPFIILATKFKKHAIKKGLFVFVFATLIATFITCYNAIRYFNEDILFRTDFVFFITIIQHPYFGIYVLIALISILEFDIIKLRPLKISVCVLFVLAIALTTSRLVYVLFLVIGSIYLLKILSIKRFVVVMLFVSVLASIFLISNKGILKKFQGTLDYNNSPRLQLWNNSYKVIKSSDAFWFGIGIGDYYQNKKDPYYAKDSDNGTFGLNPHSQLVDFYITNGVLGIFVLLIVIFFAINTIRKQNTYAIMVFSIILTFSLIECIFNRQFGVQLYAIFIPLIFKDVFKRI